MGLYLIIKNYIDFPTVMSKQKVNNLMNLFCLFFFKSNLNAATKFAFGQNKCCITEDNLIAGVLCQRQQRMS